MSTNISKKKRVHFAEINLFPKKVEYAILLQKSCLMSGRTSELGREILKYSWQENNFNRHHRRTGGEECSG